MLPITKKQAQKAAEWMKSHYKDAMTEAVAGTVFSIDHICGIACQETAFLWINWIDDLSADEVLGRCIGDASGDVPGTHRNPFPKNTAAFRAKFGETLTEMLIHEANLTRDLRGMNPREWVYKGYGIYQYDLQHILTDEDFFAGRGWYHYSQCIAKVMSELKSKFAIHKDIWKAIRGYNGSGEKATQYANNVTLFTQFSSEVSVTATPVPVATAPASAPASTASAAAPPATSPAEPAAAHPKLREIIASHSEVNLRDLALNTVLAGEVQTRLIKLGCLDPPADGDFGPVSNLVLSEFAKQAGLTLDETLNAELAEALLENSEDTFLPLTLGDDFASRILKYMKLRNYWIAKLPGFLNIVYVEGADADGTPNDDRFNKFNDRRIVIAIESGKPVIKLNVLATTEPGKFYTENPENEGGAARIAFNQYKSWRVGTHKAGRPSAHEALVQVADVAVHRDKNKDGFRSGDVIDIGSGFGINQHSGHDQDLNNIGKASAGCLVSQGSKAHRDFMALIKTDPRYAKASHGYRFMSTIIAGDLLAKEKFGE
jgi:hypothetical protein